jgi:hypothetical protein
MKAFLMSEMFKILDKNEENIIKRFIMDIGKITKLKIKKVEMARSASKMQLMKDDILITILFEEDKKLKTIYVNIITPINK